jgi:MFS family permease
MAFLNVYAARLGASGLQIGLLTAGPAVVNLWVSLPAGSWLEGRPLIPITFWTSLASRLLYVLLIFLPWLFGDRLQISVMIWLTLLLSFPAAILAISFNALFAGVVPEDRRADVVGRRNAILAISMILSTLLSGLILDHVIFPLNYQIVFAIGAVGGWMSSYHLGQLQATDPLTAGGVGNPRSDAARARPASWPFLRLPAMRLELLRGSFGRFMAAYFIFYTFQYLCLPLFPLAYVHDLKLTDGMISLGSGLFYVTMFLISLRLSRLANRFGHRALLAAAGMAFSIYPLLLGAARGPLLYWVASALGGLVWGTISASLINRLMERVPLQQRAAGMALHNLAFNLGILAGSLSGPALGEWLGVQPALLLGSGLRFLAGVLLLLWG